MLYPGACRVQWLHNQAAPSRKSNGVSQGKARDTELLPKAIIPMILLATCSSFGPNFQGSDLIPRPRVRAQGRKSGQPTHRLLPPHLEVEGEQAPTNEFQPPCCSHLAFPLTLHPSLPIIPPASGPHPLSAVTFLGWTQEAFPT